MEEQTVSLCRLSPMPLQPSDSCRPEAVKGQEPTPRTNRVPLGTPFNGPVTYFRPKGFGGTQPNEGIIRNSLRSYINGSAASAVLIAESKRMRMRMG
jgi:hypothetical protein